MITLQNMDRKQKTHVLHYYQEGNLAEAAYLLSKLAVY